MKNKIILASILFLGISSSTFIKAQNSLTINILNIKKVKGNIVIGLFNNPNQFPKDGKQLFQRKIKVLGNSLQYTFDNLPKGNYAVAVFHDENSDNKCNLNFIGIPKESYGFSNNFRPKFSAPKFKDTQFLVDNNKDIKISLIN